MAPKPGLKLEAVSPRLKRELIHPNRGSYLVGLRYSPDGKRIIAGDDPGGVVVVWDVATGKQLQAIRTDYATGKSFDHFFLTPDGRTLFAPREKAKVERVEQNGKRLYRWEFDGNVRAWDLTKGRVVRTFRHQPPRNILHMQLSPDGAKFVTFEELPGTYEGRPTQAVSRWDTRTGEHHTLPDRLESRGLFSPDGKALVITSFGPDDYALPLKLFDPATGREKLSIPLQDKNVSVFVRAFSPDGRLMVGSYRVSDPSKKGDNNRNSLKWWDTATGREVASFATEENDNFFWTCFSADGQHLAVVNFLREKGKLFLFRVPDRKLVQTIVLAAKPKRERLFVSAPVFGMDGKWLAVSSQAWPDTQGGEEVDVRDLPQPRIHLIEVSAGKTRDVLVAPQGYADPCCFSPDGRTLATGGHGKILLWDLTKPPAAAARAREP